MSPRATITALFSEIGPLTQTSLFPMPHKYTQVSESFVQTNKNLQNVFAFNLIKKNYK